MCAALVNGFRTPAHFACHSPRSGRQGEVVSRIAAMPSRIATRSDAKTVSTADEWSSKRAQSGSERQLERGNCHQTGEKHQELQCAPGPRLRRLTHSGPSPLHLTTPGRERHLRETHSEMGSARQKHLRVSVRLSPQIRAAPPHSIAQTAPARPVAARAKVASGLRPALLPAFPRAVPT
jgi:hypothetical protein